MAANIKDVLKIKILKHLFPFIFLQKYGSIFIIFFHIFLFKLAKTTLILEISAVDSVLNQ